jgi:hypothetical protein
MRIDESHRPWAIASGAILGLAVLLWFPYALWWPGGTGGNTWPGLIYGILGYAMMLFAGLLGARKKKPIWRIGRAQTWMRGHLWLGALSLPMIMLHSAFRARGPLSLVLMTLLVLTVASGIAGAILQHVIPGQILASVPLETIYEQIDEVREQLLTEAAGIVDRLCEANPVETSDEAEVHAGVGFGGVAPEPPSVAELTDAQRGGLRQVYSGSISPFLCGPDQSGTPLADTTRAGVFFEALRKQLPEPTHEAIADLAAICEEHRQLQRQRRKYLLLHGWLLVHVPLAVTLLILGGIHAVVAIHY